MKKRFKAFTLVEMLIVMGIIMILMAVGIASGRYAIRRANRIEHQNAAEQIYQGLQSYYADHREYPGKDHSLTVATAMTGPLAEYIDDFDGGSEASYAYEVDDTGQEVLVCVTYGGVQDTNMLGIYCTGNAIASGEFSPTAPSEKELEYGTTEYDVGAGVFNDSGCANWDPATSGWDVSGACTVTPAGGV
jgi:type II secretory pathway pseudopilin PulG